MKKSAIVETKQYIRIFKYTIGILLFEGWIINHLIIRKLCRQSNGFIIKYLLQCFGKI